MLPPVNPTRGSAEPRQPMIKKLTVSQWQHLTSKSEKHLAELSGTSPGGAAAELGISRQGVHKAILRGDLDMIHVVDDNRGKLVMNMIPAASIKAFKAKRQIQKRALGR